MKSRSSTGPRLRLADTTISHSAGRYCCAFRPGPGRYAPSFGELAKRHRKDRAGLRDLLAVYVNVMVAGTTTYALSPVTLSCHGSPRVTK